MTPPFRPWSRDFDQRKDSRDTAHFVFSMPPGSDPKALRKAVRSVGQNTFPDNEWVIGIHQDKQHPHAHMVVKMRGRKKDKKVRLNKPELYRLREVFAEAAREQGVELTASPRAARGVGKKSILSA
jgi:type IV secretion system T-DNA border endonuclease VirD2